MKTLFAHINEELLHWLADVLSNDEASTCDDLVQLFVKEGLTKQQAEKAVSLRAIYHNNIFMAGHSPLFEGRAKCYRFNPHLKDFEEVDPNNL